MKHFIFFLITFCVICCAHCQTANYEAANWKTFLLNDNDITVPPPPTAAETKKELNALKQQMSAADAKQSSAVQFWDAGAPAYRWNKIGSQTAATDFAVQLRMPDSWMNIAVYDATVLVWRAKIRYKRKRPSAEDASVQTLVPVPATYSYPSEHSATAAAAAYVLAYFFPAKADSLINLAKQASASRVHAGVQYTSDADAGWKIGEQVAKQIIEQAKNDGSAKQWDGTMNKDPKKWRGAYPVGYTLTAYKPMLLNSIDQFRPPAPPDFTNDMQDLKKFKQTTKSAASAYYWATTGSSWTELAGQKMFETRMQNDPPAAARVYAVLSVAYHETALSVMDAKYTYWGIRPNQFDTTYKPLIATPPFPGYPSGHAMGAASAAAVMEHFFPADAQQFRTMAQDCADSRFYAGIHFKTDNEVGLEMGRKLGTYVVNEWMKKTK